MNRIVLYLVLFVTFLSVAASADMPDSQGKDFWIAFLPNQHNNISDASDRKRLADSLYIFIAASVPTTGSIVYYDRFGGQHTENVNIPDPSKMFVFKVSFFDYELWGINTYPNRYPNQYQQETVSKMSFHIVTDNDVAVYAHSQAVTTSDAFLVLPTDVLDKDYFIASYYSEINDANDLQFNHLNTPSQFAVVASEDNTEVAITPSCPTEINGAMTQHIVLNRGETYLVQALIDSDINSHYDLTGTKVSSTKPIAVFAGHQRATIPLGIDYISRDMLAEEMLPVLYWGNNAFVTPLPTPSDEYNSQKDYYRIIAAYDNTIVDINGTKRTIANAGGFILNRILEPMFVSSDKPIMAVVYKKTSQGDNDSQRNGDPFMMVLPPKEQFMNSYLVVNIQSMELGSNGKMFEVYEEQYLCVTIPDSAKSTLKIDGVAINQAFTPIPNTDYSYANIWTRDGVKTITASVPFGISIVGYGKANSYGYTGGMSFRPQDIFPPAYEITQDCYRVSGNITEIKMNDGGLRSYSLVPGSARNTNVTLSNIFNSKRIGFDAELVDWRQDGSFELMAMDSAKNESRDTIEVYGFTVAGENTSPNELQLVKQEMLSGTPFAFDYPVHNYGRGTQTISSARFADAPEMHVASQLPISIQPGETVSIRIAVDGAADTSIVDTLILGNGCSDVRIMSLDATFFTDKMAPDTTASLDACHTAKSLRIFDTGVINVGIRSVTLVSSTNCNVDIRPINQKNWQAQVNVIDANYDAIYELLLADSAGNMRTVIDTIQGFTLAVSIAGAEKDYYDLGQIALGAQKCDTIFLRNYGLKPLFVDRFLFANNVNFSIPQAQLPTVIQPGASQPVLYCYFASNNTGFADIDSLFVSGNCLQRKLRFMALSVGSDLVSEDNCGNSISLQAQGGKPAFSLADVFPNPASGSYYVQFGIAKSAITKLQIYDMMGNLMTTLLNEHLDAGNYRRNFSTDGLTAGAYVLRLTSGSETASVMFSVVE